MTDVPDAFLPLIAEPSSAAFITDFDGTLAPIVDDPLRAQPDVTARAALAALVPIAGFVAVVSGRPARDVAAKLAVPGVVHVGCYGLETVVDDVHAVDARAEPYAPAVRAAGDAAVAQLPGLWVERKGDLAVALHWRRHPERADEVRVVARELAAEYGLVLLPGRQVAELYVPLPVDKGTAVASIIEEARTACFAGDDHGDLAAFEALARARDAGVLDAAVCVGVRSEEEPPGLADVTDLSVNGPAELGALLLAVAQRC